MLKTLQKEVQVHRALKHVHVLEFMESELVKDKEGDSMCRSARKNACGLTHRNYALCSSTTG